MASESDDSDLRERVEQLEATVEQQQATIKKMLPGRRGALKAGGLLAGGGLLGALGSERVEAADGTQDTSAGTIGAAGDSTDIYLDQLLDPGGDEILNVDDTGDINAAFGRTWDFDSVDLQNSSLTLDSLSTEVIGNGRYYARGFNGADADARLDAALSAATSGERIYLEDRVYTSTRTISKDVAIVGVSYRRTTGSVISAQWTLDGVVSVQSVSFTDSADITVNNPRSAILDSDLRGASVVTVNEDRMKFIGNAFGDVTFSSGTDGGIVDSCVGTSITDNGSNTVGDIG